MIDIRPTRDVTEYTASIAYKPLSEGKDGRQKVDSVKFALRAEGLIVLTMPHKKILITRQNVSLTKQCIFLTFSIQVLSLLRLHSQ